MSLSDERAVVAKAHAVWGESDLEAFLAFLTDDIVHNVNVDGGLVPYAASAVGKDAVRERLALLLATFEIQAFVIETMIHTPAYTRTRVLGYYKHKRSGERLDITPRFDAYVRDGLIWRIDEYHDAAYIEAFERFVGFLQEEAMRGGGAAASGDGVSSEASPNE